MKKFILSQSALFLEILYRVLFSKVHFLSHVTKKNLPTVLVKVHFFQRFFFVHDDGDKWGVG